jgi:hypothetical protein
MWVLENLDPGLEGLSMGIFTRALGWTKEETKGLLASVRKDMRDTKIHSYWKMCVTGLSILFNANKFVDITSLDKNQ